MADALDELPFSIAGVEAWVLATRWWRERVGETGGSENANYAPQGERGGTANIEFD